MSRMLLPDLSVLLWVSVAIMDMGQGRVKW